MAWEELIRSELKVYSMIPIIRSIRYSQIEKGAPFYRKLLLYIKDNTGYYYENFEDHHIVGKWLIKRILIDETFWNEHKKTWYKKFEWFNEIISKLEKTDLTKVSNKELVSLHKELLERLMNWHGYAYAVDAIDTVLNEMIRNDINSALKRKFGKGVKESVLNQYYSDLTTAKEMTYINKEQILLLEIALNVLKDKELKKLFRSDIFPPCNKNITTTSDKKMISASDNEILAIEKELDKNTKKFIEINKLINRLLKQYYWTTFTWDISEAKTRKDVIKDVTQILSEKGSVEELTFLFNKIINHTKNVTELKQKIVKELELSVTFKTYLEIFEEYAIYHDLRKEGQVKGTYYSYKILKEYCRRLNFDFELARSAIPEEMQDYLLTRKIDGDKLNKRKNEVLLIITHDSFEEVYGKKAGEQRDKETKVNVNESISEFQGLSANPGRVRGIAKVCISAKDAIQRIKEGDILVTGMTMPEFLPAMKKASAIITDEGGLTCHAAIISRELGKPCIVGTKISTRTIKDGCTIEVNANHGIIKIVNS